ncbi:hypothetical protein ABWH89_08340 [Hoeflea alexandrii]|uniref:hypothetical protein n=1 Tax=Hoeflea alexandrii TaxID=288436 RepID=UPI0035D052A3
MTPSSNSGRVDLVEAMLWEIPLTVALHFLGVPKEDMDALKEFSVAHTVNTWGKPSPEQQLKVADAVGRFWQYAGTVLEKMRREPDGTGWMHHAIRMNAEIPEVVTDSYLHSMMMAIIVAGHETTSLASTNALKLLLSDRLVWERICKTSGADPERDRGMPAARRLGGCLAPAGDARNRNCRRRHPGGGQAADRQRLGQS